MQQSAMCVYVGVMVRTSTTRSMYSCAYSSDDSMKLSPINSLSRYTPTTTHVSHAYTRDPAIAHHHSAAHGQGRSSENTHSTLSPSPIMSSVLASSSVSNLSYTIAPMHHVSHHDYSSTCSDRGEGRKQTWRLFFVSRISWSAALLRPNSLMRTWSSLRTYAHAE